MATKRVISLEETTTPADDDYLMLDGDTNGTRKISYADLVEAIKTAIAGSTSATE